MPELVIPWHWALVYDLDRRRWPTQFHGEACQMSSSRSFHPGHRQTRTALNDNYKMLCCRSAAVEVLSTAEQHNCRNKFLDKSTTTRWVTVGRRVITNSATAARHTLTLNALVGRSGRFSSHRHTRHKKTVLSVSCLVRRRELDNCFERAQTSNFLSATVLSCRESSSHRRSGRDTDKTVLSCLAWRCGLALSCHMSVLSARNYTPSFRALPVLDDLEFMLLGDYRNVCEWLAYMIAEDWTCER